MFHGTIPQPVKQIVTEMVRAWRCEHVHIACSGNFTSERMLTEIGGFQLHSNDVTIYSTAIGNVMAGQPLGIEPKPDLIEVFPWLAPYLGVSDHHTLATLMLCTRLFEGVSKDGVPKDNAYYQRMTDAYERQWPGLHDRTLTRIENNAVEIQSYTCEDAFTWADSTPRDQAFMCYPPFYGATGDYEQQFAKLGHFFAWDAPEYADFDDAQLEKFWHKVAEHDYWVFGTKDRWPDFEPFLKGMAQTTNRGLPIYLYGSHGETRVVGPIHNPRLQPGERLGDTLRICPVDQAQFQTLRSQYMNVDIKPGQPSLAFAVLVDDTVIGSFAWSVAPTTGGGDPTWIYLLSDFPVDPTDYQHLAKLVLYAALSTEAKLLAERLSKHRIRKALTTAFTDRPVSMKYRGLFDLHTRKEAPDDNPHRFMLNYLSDMGRWSLAEGYALWQKKSGRCRT